MIYEFTDEAGEPVELAMPVSEAPDIGATIAGPDGRLLTRVASLPPKPTETWKPYVSRRLPRHMDGAETNASGQPIVRTQAEERSLASRLGWERE